MSASILIVEDDENISKLISYSLEKSGFTSTVINNGQKAFDIIRKKTFDLIILDIMLPEIDGLEVCKKIKSDNQLSSIPVIMLTAKSEEVDRIVGFELGADDYVTKPFSPRELVLRVKAILKRGHSSSEENKVISLDPIKIDVSRHKVTVGNKEIYFTSIEFNLLKILVERKGRVQSREKLLGDVWDIAADVTTRTVDTHIKRLRSKLGNAGDLIETVRGLGYRMKEQG